MKPIEKAISLFGTQTKLAVACGVTQPAVHNWLNGSQINAEHAIALEAATECAVTRQDIRPDLFGDAA